MGSISFDYEPEHDRFRLTVDGEERMMPTLKGDDLRRWHVRIAQLYPERTEALKGLVPIDLAKFDEFVRVNERTMEEMVDALMAYDRTGALGSRDWIENRLTDAQILLILRRIRVAHA